MIQLLLLLIGVALLIIAMAQIRRLPKPQKKWLLIQIGIGICVVSLLFILMTGRIHWLGIIIGALVPILKILLVKPSREKSQPHAANTTETESERNHQPPATPTSMDIQEALNILGIEGDIANGEITAELVIDTHRKLIQKFHPDRGGNDYLAAKINQAKDTLLATLNN